MTLSPSKSAPTVQTHRKSSLAHRKSSLVWFALTTLLSAFLVFQVQPVISKCVLPWFGGTPAVWTTCMLFFQVLLFAGYAYAHLSRTFLAPAGQGTLHLILLVVAAFCLPIHPSDAWKPIGDEAPTTYLLWLLAAHVGVPYFVLSSTGPLIQAWMSYRDDSDRVYRLYALSNVGSLSALLSYPFLIEPFISVTGQSVVWSMMFCGFVLAEGWLAAELLKLARRPATTDTADTIRNKAVPKLSRGRNPNRDKRSADAKLHLTVWIALPAFASLMLLVVTNHVCQDVAVIPFLWVLPLSLYLLSFIICFDSPAWYRPKPIAGMTLLCLAATQADALLPTSLRLIAQTGGSFGLLFGVCLLCHGEAARLKPAAHRLTLFYMCLSAGGAIGGLIVAIVCPIVFDTHMELPISLAIATAGGLAVFVSRKSWGPIDPAAESGYDWNAAYRLRFGVLALVSAPIVTCSISQQDELVASSRNFFGVLKVTRDADTTKLIHGRTIHGIQRHGQAASEPTSYYGRESGVGRTIRSMQRSHDKLHIGVVGLGCGVLSTYGRSADVLDLIEINPDVVTIATKYFSFLADSAALQRIHMGDGRLVLERMQAAEFDLLVLDAFSSDAIPAHLLTREAFQLYKSRLNRDGVIAVHVSNNHLDLVPLVHRLAESAGLHSRVFDSVGDAAVAVKQARWVVLAPDAAEIWRDPMFVDAAEPAETDRRSGPLWTDQHHNLASVLKIW